MVLAILLNSMNLWSGHCLANILCMKKVKAQSDTIIPRTEIHSIVQEVMNKTIPKKKKSKKAKWLPKEALQIDKEEK